MQFPRQQKSLTAIMFDLDDTLIDWSKRVGDWQEITRLHLDNVYDYLSGLGHSLPDRELFLRRYVEVLIHSWDEAKKTWAGVRFADVLRLTFASFDLEVEQIDLNAVMAAYEWRPMPGVVPFEDTISVLAALQQQGYRMGLITNSMFPMWMRDIELQAYNILHYFDVRLTSGDAGYMKPHPAIYHRALESLGASPEQSLFVGDRPENDIAGANEVGMISVLITPPHVLFEQNSVQPDYTIACLSELLPILAELEQEGE